jgi:antitoxin component YwqK of YwqJK toxin-antitoxin module
MKNFVLAIFLILALEANAQDKKIVTMNGNGSIEEVGYLTSDGKKDSTWTRYNDMGIVIGTAQFSQGKKHGVWETYNDKGVKLFEIVYVDGNKTHGKHWDENGVLIETKEY